MPHELIAVDPRVVPAGWRNARLFGLCVVFIVSGFCGLIYESIWSHYLKLFVGHAAYAQTVVLIVFIGGMAIGAAVVGRFAKRIRHPLIAYAAVEVAIGLLSLVFHPTFVATTEWGYATLLPATCAPETPCLSQWLLAAALILPQSILLGTTFPLMTSGILRLEPRDPGASIALFYFLNSIGAVFGVLASAFVLIPALGLPGTLFTAGLLNIGVGIAAYLFGKGAPADAAASGPSTFAVADTVALRRLLLVVAALTGLSSFVYEIAWIRMLSLVIGASTDAFELMLAAFILGLALGGLWVRSRIDAFRDLIASLAVVQVLMGVAAVGTLPLYDSAFDLLAWLLQSLNRSHEGYALYNVASHVVSLLVMLPATFLAGMTLPLITTALLRGRQGEGAIGFVYAANTLGAIAGVVIAVHFALPQLGLKGALLLGAAVDVGLAIVLFAYRGWRPAVWMPVAWSAGGVAALVAIASLVQLSEHRMASGVYRMGIAGLPDNMNIAFHRVGKTANVNVLMSDGTVSIRTNGKSDAAMSLDAAVPGSDEYTMAFTAVLPLALVPRAEHAAIIGFGSGMTTATLLASPLLKRVDTIEIEPEMAAGARLFGAPVERAYTDPRSRIVIDDAKSFFARSSQRYDLIVSEPSNPWVSGVASLFTVEFYRRVSRQLSDDGVFVQWIQAYEFSNALLGTILRSIDAEFADYAVYAANDGDMIVVAAKRKLPEATDAFTRFPDLAPIVRRLSMASVDEVEFRRLAGATTVRALLADLRPGVNSDYYPLVDHHAPRERFLKSTAKALLQLHSAPVPLVEMLERRPAPAPRNVGAAKAFHERREALQAALASATWLGEGARSEPTVPMPRDIGMLRAALWECAAPPPRVRLRDMMYEIAVYVNPHLPAREATAVWASLRNAPCAARIGAEDRVWLDLFEATAARDATRMASLGVTLAAHGEGVRTDLRTFAVMAGATGLVARGRNAEAADFLSRLAPAIPEAMRNDAMLQILRGYAARAAGV